MEKLPMPSAVSQGYQSGSSEQLPTTTSGLSSMPAVSNRRTDIDIPRSVWSAWIPSNGAPREIRRPLTVDERVALEQRRDELAPALAPFAKRSVNRLVQEIGAMYGGFPSMRTGSDEAIVGRASSLLDVLVKFPAWAIVKACINIREKGIWRDGAYDRKWPPSDAEIIAAVREEVRLYGDQHRSAVALLAATVET